MTPTWLTVIAIVAIGLGALSAAWIVIDVLVRGYRQRMAIMEVVWPVTALYFGPAAVWAYQKWGRPNSRRWRDEHGDPPERSFPVVVALADSHCGAGCTLGDIAGASLVFVIGLELFGRPLWPELIVDFSLAYSLGIVFQYLTIAPMRGLGLRDGIVAALRADTLSLIAFEVGLFGWMIVLQLVLFAEHPLTPVEPAYWLMMQFGMVLGFATAYPANWWLVRRGWKERM